MNSTPAAPAPPLSRGWTIGRIADAPVIVTPSWFLAAAVLTFLFAPWVLRQMPELGTAAYLVAATFVLMLFASVFLHEVAHALVARARGQEVHELAITLWGGHTAYSGGLARPLDAILVAVVGPLTNLALAALGWFAFLGRQEQGLDVPTLLLLVVAISNAFVGFFNLLPGLPLDGGQILEAVVWWITGSRSTGTVTAGWTGRLIAVGVVLWSVGWPLARGLRPELSTVLWTVLVAGFLWMGAGSALRNGRRRAAVAGLRAGDLAGPAVTVRLGDTIGEAIAARPSGQPGPDYRFLVVVDPDGSPMGVVDERALTAVPPGQHGSTPVDAVAVPFVKGSAVGADETGQDLLNHLAASSGGDRLVPVIADDRVTGVLDLATVAKAVRSS